MSEAEGIYAAVWWHAEVQFCKMVNEKRHVIEPIPWDRVHDNLKPAFREHIRTHGHPWRKP